MTKAFANAQSGIEHPARQCAYQFVFVQALLGMVWVLSCALFMTIPVALSALFGVAVAVIANGYFASKVLASCASGRFAKKMVRIFYRAQAMKVVITVVMFAIYFAFLPVHAGAFFAGLYINTIECVAIATIFTLI